MHRCETVEATGIYVVWSHHYLVTLALQLIPYTLAGGAGVNLGMAYFHPRTFYQGDKWFGLPVEAVP